MKQCPVCAAMTFDDMEVCYGCLHRFGEEGAKESVSRALDEADGLRPHDARGGFEGALAEGSGIVSGGGPREAGAEPSAGTGAGDAADERPPRAYRLEIMLVPVDGA